MYQPEDNFLFIDLETTGLDPFNDKIVEVAWTTTKGDLRMPMSIFSRTIVPMGDALQRIYANPVVEEMHRKTGLLDELEHGDVELLSRLPRVEEEIVDHLRRRSNEGERWHYVGASVHFDAGFIAHWMPRLAKRMHHRILDTSSLKLALGSMGIELPEPANQNSHRAANDVQEVIDYVRAFQRWAGKQWAGGAEASEAKR